MSFQSIFKTNHNTRPEIFVSKINIENTDGINISATDGSIFYAEDSILKPLGIGAEDEVLKVGASGLPEWGAGGGGGPATALATSDPLLTVPLTVTQPNQIVPNQFLGFNNLTGGAIWKQPDAPISLKSATQDIIINTNDPSAPGETLVYNGLGQAVWQAPQVGLQTAYETDSEINQQEGLSIITNLPLGPAPPTVGGPYNNFRNNLQCLNPNFTNYSIFDNFYSTNIADKFQEPESMSKNFLDTAQNTQTVVVSAYEVDGNVDNNPKYALSTKPEINPIFQQIYDGDIPSNNEFIVGVLGVPQPPVSLSIASLVPIFTNNQDYIQVGLDEKFFGLDIQLSVPAGPLGFNMPFKIEYYDSVSLGFVELPDAFYEDNMGNFTVFSGRIRWDPNNPFLTNWVQDAGLYSIRVVRNDIILPPPQLPVLADNGIQVLKTSTCSWSKEGKIFVRNAEFIDGAQFGSDQNSFTLPNFMPYVGTSLSKANYMLISDQLGNMQFKQSPYLFSSNDIVSVNPIASPPGFSVINQTSIDPVINGSLTVPANAFFTGNSFRVEMGGICSFSTNANNIIEVVAKSGPLFANRVTLAQISCQVNAATDGAWKLQANFNIHVTGAPSPGPSKLTNFVEFSLQPDNGAVQTFSVSAINLTVDTTIDQRLEVTINSDGGTKSISTYFMSIVKSF